MDYVVHPTVAGLTEKALKDLKITDLSKKEELREACYTICFGISSVEQITDRIYLFLETRMILDPITAKMNIPHLTGSYFNDICPSGFWAPADAVAVEFLTMNGMPAVKAEGLIQRQVKSNEPEAR